MHGIPPGTATSSPASCFSHVSVLNIVVNNWPIFFHVLLSGISIVSSLSFHGDQSKAATFVLWPVRAISCVNAGLINESVLRGSAPPDYNRTGTVGSPRLTANIALPSMQSYECLIREKDRICTQLLSRELHVCYLPMFFEICVSSVVGTSFVQK